MHNIIKKVESIPVRSNIVYLMRKLNEISEINIPLEEANAVRMQNAHAEKTISVVYKTEYSLFFYIPKEIKNRTQFLEECRKAGDKLQSLLNDYKLDKVIIVNRNYSNDETLAFAEGMALGNYQFVKYKKNSRKESTNTLKEIDIYSKKIKDSEIEELNIIVNSVYHCRNLVNEPASYLNATKLSEEIMTLGKEAGFKVEVLNKKKIEALKMGGLLAVNKGSIDPPTFSILEWKPAKTVNKKPYVLVGKGIVFDTGGINLKPGTHMEDMKCDMAGAAAVASAVNAIAKAKFPVYVVGLVPSTDNRLNGNAYVPGDVVTMFDSSTVEVLNTDAEGRMILADALSYAKKYNPELVIDLATLTGAAAIAIGKYGIVAMGSDAEKEFDLLKTSGENVFERVVEFPFWDDYAELIKSEVADIKNVGGRDAGAITAGKFLEKFTDYPWIHLDIAGPAYVDKKYNYRGSGATGVGVRLLFEFIKHKCK
jgi:leucyl aminopeptidase